MGVGNEKDDEKWESGWTEWIPELWTELGTEAPPEELMEPTLTVERELGSTTSPDTDVIVPAGAKLLPMTKSKLLCSPNYDRDIRHFEFDLSKSSVMYNTGDSLGVYPWNEPSQVAEFLKWYGLQPNEILKVTDSSNSGKFPNVMTAAQVFTQVLDILGRPSRKFYETLAIVAEDPNEANEIRFLMSKEGKQAFKEFLQETPTYVDLMKRWPSAKLPLEYLMDLVPQIKPRLYSIASSPDHDGDNLQLCIVADDWNTPSGRYRHGLTTRYLRDLAPTAEKPMMVAARVNNASFELPADSKVPVILVALGTGIAPCRAVIRDRIVAQRNGEEVGPMALFFGIRNRAEEYSYGEEEWEKLHDGGNGILTVLQPAFSRDQAKKIYVQHRLEENAELIYDWIVKKNGYYLLCGPGGPPCVASKEAVISAIATHGAKDGFNQQKAEQYVTDMQISGRFNEEVW
eukprot:NODE_541_length_1631_cov_321.685209_g449_i0.p1 GENE.NODE_541_length_1631_cov_321.685209_g449_i0~~NODE_541_length_1631_cov_321.685209_g449_i0.p1  ORF type:complete len:472 (+),score=162.91 NODE_541_length_1631_cov_321.685209_g449_i0:43-1416(+)